MATGRGREEYWTQRSFFDFIDQFLSADIYEPCRWTFAIPNGGSRHPAEAMNLKLTGVKRGVPDVCNPLSSADKSKKGFYFEFKSSIGKPSKEQKAFLERMEQDGWTVGIYTDYVPAIAKMLDHFGLPYPKALQNAISYPRG